MKRKVRERDTVLLLMPFQILFLSKLFHDQMWHCMTRQYAQIFHQPGWQFLLPEETSHICVYSKVKKSFFYKIHLKTEH